MFDSIIHKLIIQKKNKCREKMQRGNRRNRKRKKEEREGYKEINRVEHICRIRGYKSFLYFSIFVTNMIFYESFQFGMGKLILIYTKKIFSEFALV